MRVRVTQSFGAIRVAAAGFGAGMLGSIFTDQARQALAFASSLTEASRAIGVTVEQYQILNRAAIENGASTESMERAVGILNRTLGQARAGMQGAVETFRALRIDPEQFRSAGELLPTVMERIRNLRTVSEQAAAAQRLMGRGAQALLPLLAQGAEGYERYAQEAREAGLITDEMARKADEAADKLALLGVTLRTRLAAGLMEILPLIEEVAIGLNTMGNAAANAMRQIANAMGMSQQAQARAASALPTIASRLNMLNMGPLGAVVEGVRGIGRWQQAQNPESQIARNFQDMLNFNRNNPVDTGDMDLDLSGGGGRARRGGRDNAEREREKALRDEAEFQSSLRRFRADLIRAQQEQVADTVARGQIELQILDIEREQYAADLLLQVQLKDLTEARAQELMLAYERVDEEKRQTLALTEMRETDEQNLQISQVRADLAADALRHEADMADTSAERREAEMRLLDLTYRQERARLEAVMADESAGRVAVEEARLRLENLDQWRAREGQSIRSQTMGPLESFLEGLPTTAARANEALQQVAVDGLQSLEDGIVGVISGTKSLADAFGDMAKSILADLIRIQVQRMIIGPLSNALGAQFGMPGIGGGTFGAGGGSGSILDAAMALAPGAFASGGSFTVGGRSGIDRNLLSLNGTPVAKVSQGETVGVGWGGFGGKIQIIPSPYFDVVVDGRARHVAAPLAGQAAVVGSANAQESMHKRATRQIP